MNISCKIKVQAAVVEEQECCFEFSTICIWTCVFNYIIVSSSCSHGQSCCNVISSELQCKSCMIFDERQQVVLVND
jgi:hypothetical protein